MPMIATKQYTERRTGRDKTWASGWDTAEDKATLRELYRELCDKGRELTGSVCADCGGCAFGRRWAAIRERQRAEANRGGGQRAVTRRILAREGDGPGVLYDSVADCARALRCGMSQVAVALKRGGTVNGMRIEEVRA